MANGGGWWKARQAALEGIVARQLNGDYPEYPPGQGKQAKVKLVKG